MSHRLCSYCGSEIAFGRRLKGELYCSSEHAELDFQHESQKALARLVSMPSLFPPRKKPSRPLTSEVQEHGLGTHLDSTTASPEARMADALVLMPIAIPPQPATSNPAETEWSNGICATFSGLRLPKPAPLDQCAQVDLAITSKAEPPQPNVERNLLDAQPVTDAALSEATPEMPANFVPTAKKPKRAKRVRRYDSGHGRRSASAGRLSVGGGCPNADARGVSDF